MRLRLKGMKLEVWIEDPNGDAPSCGENRTSYIHIEDVDMLHLVRALERLVKGHSNMEWV